MHSATAGASASAHSTGASGQSTGGGGHGGASGSAGASGSGCADVCGAGSVHVQVVRGWVCAIARAAGFAQAEPQALNLLVDIIIDCMHLRLYALTVDYIFSSPFTYRILLFIMRGRCGGEGELLMLI